MSPKITYSEQELVMLLQKRDNSGFNYLYENYSGALYGIINNIVNETETANDVLQDVFVNIWKKIDQYDPQKGRLFTWMLNIARNASIDKVRSRNYQDNRKNQPISEDVDKGMSVINPLINDTGLKKVLTKLKDEHRQLVDLSFFQGFTHEEIAKMLSIPLGTVKTRIRTALSQLRIMLQ